MLRPSTVRCGRCGSESKEGSQYCHVCGAPLSALTMADCPRCGARSVGSGNYCTNCGAGLVTSAARRPRSRISPLASVLIILAAALVTAMILNSFGPVLEPSGPPEYSMGTGTVEYSWVHERRTYNLQVNITAEEYQRYREDNIPRQAHSFTQMIQISDDYVTSDDRVVREVAASFERTRADLGLDRAETAKLVLSFVQNIDYVEDSESTLRDEYWRYPVETLQDRVGDCEDKVFLFASVMEAMGFDVVALYFEGHAAAGIDLEGATGSHYRFEGRDYYFCETTARGWAIGESPPGLSSAYIAQVS